MGAVDDSFGAWYIGQQFATLLLGVSILQTWMFWTNSERDPAHLKALVIFLLVLGLGFNALVSAGLYHFLVSSIGNPEAMMEVPWTLKAEPFLSAANVFIVQWFYAFRLFRLTRNYALLIVVMLLGASQLATGYAAAVFQLGLTGTIVSGTAQKNLACASLAVDLVVDAIITAAMVHFLRTHRTGIKSTESLMNTLTNYTLASGFSTFVCSCVILGTYVALPDTQIYSGISFLLPHLYTNSLLALLNARRSLRHRSTVGRTSESLEPSRHTDRTPHATMPFFELTSPKDSRGTSSSPFTSTALNFTSDSDRRHTLRLDEEQSGGGKDRKTSSGGF
ncbi:hypothetical protein EXIGLDRAFT_730124 [Exidia glandulosa HHB12029]|uniref:DUF6534 domain-containing protein n=1 Tax=Exidia glandulosa HHB12029 TaxID=1314781 RepID=A0A165ZF91_EXIGL|nr:hypothetical protein EXIGLDRAFT_730124 [Exidia glandulosa HHB12029]